MTELPKQICSAVIRIGDVDVEVVQLNNGMRLITQESMERLTGADLLAAFVDVQKTHQMSAGAKPGTGITEISCICGWSDSFSMDGLEGVDDLMAELSRRHLQHIVEDQALRHE